MPPLSSSCPAIMPALLRHLLWSAAEDQLSLLLPPLPFLSFDIIHDSRCFPRSHLKALCTCFLTGRLVKRHLSLTVSSVLDAPRPLSSGYTERNSTGRGVAAAELLHKAPPPGRRCLHSISTVKTWQIFFSLFYFFIECILAFCKWKHNKSYHITCKLYFFIPDSTHVMIPKTG